MKISLKSYQTIKLKKYFRNKSLFVVFHCVKLDSREWVEIEQKLKKLNVDYYKPLNKILLKELKNSVYSNYSYMINGSLLFISFNSVHNLNKFVNTLKPLFVDICLKLDDKIYLSQNLAKFQNLSYKENMDRYHRTFNKSLKISYKLTRKSK